MSKAIENIDKFLKETQIVGKNTESYPNQDDELLFAMTDFIMSLDPDTLDDEQLDMYMEIMDQFDGDEEDDYVGYIGDEDEEEDFEDLEDDDMFEEEDGVSEAAIRMRRDKAVRRERRKEYKVKRAKIKQAAKRFRKTVAYKKYQKKKKMMAKQGRTARGKRVKKFVE